MLMAGGGAELSIALVNAAVLALWAALPGLIFCYIRQALAMRRMRPQFSLHKSEAGELDRAVKLYDEVRRRIAGIEPAAEPTGASAVWRALFVRQDDDGTEGCEELEDLQAHARHLRSTIMGLKRRPLRRLQSWIHVVCLRSALARALAAYVMGFVLLVAIGHGPEQSAWLGDAESSMGGALAWYPLDERLFFANAAAACFGPLAAAWFYLLERWRLRRQYDLEFAVLEELAQSDPECAVELPSGDCAAAEELPPAGVNDPWFIVLGLSPAATIGEVKDAYKSLIKQNHPDRVHGMAPVFRNLAEAETKKINAAYRQALDDVDALASAA
jgi:hypothetical protein